MDLKKGMLVMLVGIAIFGMTASSVSAAWTITDITGDTQNKDGYCSGDKRYGSDLTSICESHILPGGHVDAKAEAQGTSSGYDKEEYTYYYGWPYTIQAYARATSDWAYASTCRY